MNSSDRYRAYSMIADLVGCRAGQLPGMSPEQFACSEWEFVGVYQSAQGIRECMMGVWERAGVNTRCPSCGRYARNVVSFGGNGKPNVLECEYCDHKFGPGVNGKIKPPLNSDEIADRRMKALFQLFKD